MQKGILYRGEKEHLKYSVHVNRDQMGKQAAAYAAEHIIHALEQKDEVRIIFAAAPSQDEMLFYLMNNERIDWSRIIAFHMDEYIGLPENSDQWFSNYLKKNISDKVNLKLFHFINGMNKEPNDEISRYVELLQTSGIDLVCLGIGENGHVAFNDPPVADFSDKEVMKVVELDEVCRQQQVNDGCFSTFNSVPTHALTLTIPTLLSADCLVCTVPGEAKRNAVAKVLNDPISTSCPATILRKHKNGTLFLDEKSFLGGL